MVGGLGGVGVTDLDMGGDVRELERQKSPTNVSRISEM